MTDKGHILEPFLDKEDHPSVLLRGDDGRLKKMRVCDIVAITFIGPCPEGQVVKHRDGNIRNNAANNLFYGPADD